MFVDKLEEMYAWYSQYFKIYIVMAKSKILLPANNGVCVHPDILMMVSKVCNDKSHASHHVWLLWGIIEKTGFYAVESATCILVIYFGTPVWSVYKWNLKKRMQNKYMY